MENTNVHRRVKDNSGVYRFSSDSMKEDEKKSSRDDLHGSFSKPPRPLPVQQGGRVKDMAFWVAVILSQVFGLLCIALVIRWCQMYEGFGWEDPKQQFYYHPLLMVLGLVFCYGDAIIIYRVLSFMPKWILKIIHATLHIFAILCSSIALAAMLENHRRTNKADFYSLHSWIGIATFGMFGLQYLGSFVTFMLPWVPNVWRARIMPFHTFFGVGLFVLAVATAEMGLTEKLIWTDNYTTNKYVPKAVVGNSLGLCLVVFAFLIVFITTHAAYKRRPLPEELPAMSTN
ncbi:transmembrane ascorbate-dependent reductase CYB561-like isoform X1 [Argiope bruennichi]|uniref:Cytochrome b561 like protein n=1 Tax=Argiope bruennichi TaxID=94029 RepID=A0A8T0F1L2_ARGBR|nr:transmembrane ascorbate-dependent reductase CYB561-like isoform X1 [Argiope bruennichi]KAF8782798.1 Cytochrome b561 like protein [Argiope bruennichi]